MRDVRVGADLALRAEEVKMRDARVVLVQLDDDGGVWGEVPFWVVAPVWEKVNDLPYIWQFETGYLGGGIHGLWAFWGRGLDGGGGHAGEGVFDHEGDSIFLLRGIFLRNFWGSCLGRGADLVSRRYTTLKGSQANYIVTYLSCRGAAH